MPVQNLRVFGKSKQITTIGKNLWSLGNISFNGYKELSVNYLAGNYVLSYNIETEATSTTAQLGINVDGDWKYYQVKKDNRAAIKISSATGITAVRFYAGDSPAYNVNAKYYDIQIEKGTDKTNYEPYTGGKPSPSPEYQQEITSCGENGIIDLKITGNNAEPQTLTLSTPNGLPGLKVNSGGNYTDETGQQWITDEINLARGKYVQRIAKKIFDGNEQLSDNLGTRTSFWLRVDDIRPETGLCNYGKIVKVNTIEQEELSFSISGTGIYLYTTKTADEFKNELKQKYDSGKPVEVLYALKTPVEIDLPAETIATFKKLHTNYSTTIVSNNADAGMELTYTVDAQSYVDKKIAEISTAIVQKGI